MGSFSIIPRNDPLGKQRPCVSVRGRRGAASGTDTDTQLFATPKTLSSLGKAEGAGLWSRRGLGLVPSLCGAPLLLSSPAWLCTRVGGGQPAGVSGLQSGPGPPAEVPSRSLRHPQHRRQQMLLVSLHFNRFTSIPLCVTEKLGVNPILRTQWNSLLEERFGKSFREVNNNQPLVKLVRRRSRISSREAQFTWKASPTISFSRLVEVLPPHHTAPLPCVWSPPYFGPLSPALGLPHHAPGQGSAASSPNTRPPDCGAMTCP